MNNTALLRKQWRQEWRVVARHPAVWLHPTLFLGLVVLIFGFALGSEAPAQTVRIWPVLLWISALLAQLLAVDRLFKQEYREGSLDAWFLSPLPRSLLLLTTLLPLGLFILVPLVVTTGLLAWLLGLSVPVIGVLLATLLLGLPSLFLWGALGAALTLRAQSSHLLIGLILLPFYAPVVIFATLAIQSASMTTAMWPAHLALLGAFLLLSIMFLPFAIIAALRATTA